MPPFVPREKMSRKARKELDSRRRSAWSFSPVTRKVESKKVYSRKQKSRARFNDFGMGFCFTIFVQ